MHQEATSSPAARTGDTSLLSTVAAAATDLQRKYAPDALGGTGADAAFAGPARTGAGLAADPAPESVEGYSPDAGYPKDATVSEAARGGKAGSLAPLAAAVASGQPESSAQHATAGVRLLQSPALSHVHAPNKPLPEAD